MYTTPTATYILCIQGRFVLKRKFPKHPTPYSPICNFYLSCRPPAFQIKSKVIKRAMHAK